MVNPLSANPFIPHINPAICGNLSTPLQPPLHSPHSPALSGLEDERARGDGWVVRGSLRIGLGRKAPWVVNLHPGAGAAAGDDSPAGWLAGARSIADRPDRQPPARQLKVVGLAPRGRC
jgi:hypothetical protein